MNKSSQQNIKQTKKDPKYECIDEQGKIKYYNTLREIATDTGLDIGAISRFIRNKTYLTIGGNNRGRPPHNIPRLPKQIGYIIRKYEKKS